MSKLKIILFVLIFILGVCLRFYDLGKVPDSLNWDEVSWGYNGYSILKTGHDEHGAFLPLSFKAFGDYKQPVYVYLTSISTSIFGLNSFAVRFPSAFLGSLTILFVPFLILGLFANERYKYKLALAVMLFFSISPWSIQFSRVAYEANVGLFFVISGISLFLYGINSKNKILSTIGVLLMSVSCYSYHSNKLFTPILLIGFLVFLIIESKIIKKQAILFFLLFLLFNLFWIIDPRTTARGRSVTFLSNQTPILENSVNQLISDNTRDNALGKIFHNRRIVYANYYLENYLKHFGLNFLFLEGDNARHHTFGMGVLFFVSLPLIILGLIRLNLKKYWILLFWLFIAPIPSALAVDAPNASRSLAFLPIWQIFEGLGFLNFFYVGQSIKRKFIFLTISILLVINLFYFIHNYFNHTHSEYGKYWQHGYEEVMKSANSYSKKGEKVLISEEFEQPYIFYLFHNQIEPSRFLAAGGSEIIKQTCYHIDNVFFGKCSNNSNVNIVISKNNLDQSKYIKVEDIRDKDGLVVGVVYRNM